MKAISALLYQGISENVTHYQKDTYRLYRHKKMFKIEQLCSLAYAPDLIFKNETAFAIFVQAA